MFGRLPKINNNYYLSPHGEAYLSKQATIASIIAGAALALMLPALIMWIYPGIGALLWIYEVFEAQVAYTLLFICSLVGLTACLVLSFFGYKLRKKVMQRSAPTLGFRRSSYNGAFFTAIIISALALFQLVLIIGYHVALGSGYIDSVITTHSLESAGGVDVIGIIILVFYALSALTSWAYYFFTFRINRTMQLVMPDAEPAPDDAPAIPSADEAEAHRPQHDDDDYTPPLPTFSLTDEEKELGKHEFEDK